jgi:hypothetical protein
MSITLEIDEPEAKELIKLWIKIGRNNPWIKYACDPPFNEISFCECSSIDELAEKIGHGNWCLGAAFFYKNICFINQVDGGDEWLTIKDDYAFESFTFSRIIKDGLFKGYIERLLAATREQCIKLEY